MDKSILSVLLAASFLALVPPAASASDIAQFKKVAGSVFVEREGARLPAEAGGRVRQHDVIVTGSDGSAGLTFADNSLLSVGPDSTLALDRFVFDSTTHEGRFDSSLKKGTLAVVSGKIVKQSPGAMTVRTPSAILGARGTEFVVRAE